MATSTKPKAGRAPRTVRTSVTVPGDVYQRLGQMAKVKKVSVAWVIRDAVEKYVNDDAPLFRTGAA